MGGRFLGSHRGRPTAADLLLNPLVEAAVFEVSPDGVYGEGLAFDDCDVAVVQGGEARADLPDESETWRRILVESVSPLGTAIFSADDPVRIGWPSAVAARCCSATPRPPHPLLVAQRALGSKTAFWREGAIWVASGDREVAIATTGEAHPPATAVILAACAAWCAGAPVERIGQAIPSLAAVLATGSLQPDQPRAA